MAGPAQPAGEDVTGITSPGVAGLVENALGQPGAELVGPPPAARGAPNPAEADGRTPPVMLEAQGLDKLVKDWLTLEEAQMAHMTAFEAKTRFGELLARVAKGEEVVITRHDRPVARVVPEGGSRAEAVAEAVAGLRELQQRIRTRSRAKLSDREVRAAIEKGRL